MKKIAGNSINARILLKRTERFKRAAHELNRYPPKYKPEINPHIHRYVVHLTKHRTIRMKKIFPTTALDMDVWIVINVWADRTALCTGKLKIASEINRELRNSNYYYNTTIWRERTIKNWFLIFDSRQPPRFRVGYF